MGTATVAGLVGYRIGWRDGLAVNAPPGAEPIYVPLPFPIPPTKPVAPTFQVQFGDGGQTLAVPRRTMRLYYDGQAWDHISTTAAGVWVYEPTARDTPRQAWMKTRPEAV
jgi:hypothetical protein